MTNRVYVSYKSIAVIGCLLFIYACQPQAPKPTTPSPIITRNPTATATIPAINTSIPTSALPSYIHQVSPEPGTSLTKNQYQGAICMEWSIQEPLDSTNETREEFELEVDDRLLPLQEYWKALGLVAKLDKQSTPVAEYSSGPTKVCWDIRLDNGIHKAHWSYSSSSEHTFEYEWYFEITE